LVSTFLIATRVLYRLAFIFFAYLACESYFTGLGQYYMALRTAREGIGLEDGAMQQTLAILKLLDLKSSDLFLLRFDLLMVLFLARDHSFQFRFEFTHTIMFGFLGCDD
jgi:hypothetical protein